jgi:hypothetical protein
MEDIHWFFFYSSFPARLHDVCFIILPFLVLVLFTLYVQGVLKFKDKLGTLRVNVRGFQMALHPSQCLVL